MAEEGGRLTNVVDLLFKVKDSFHSSIDPSSLVKVMADRKLLKKKEKKFLDISDGATVSSYIYSKFFRPDGHSTITSQDFIDLVRASDDKKNLNFADHLQTLFDESEKQFMAMEKMRPVEGQTMLEVDTITDGKTVPMQSTSGSTFIHTDPDELASAVFTSEGGILYSPYHGVTVYIPKGAIPEGQTVRVSFWPVVDSEELRILLSHPLFSGAFLCSHVFNFEAKLTKGEVEEVFDAFSLDVWIEVPYYMVCDDITSSPQSPLFVLSQRDNQVQCENNVVFAPGYPYANICVRHFSKYSIAARRPLHFTLNHPRVKHGSSSKYPLTMNGLHAHSGSFEKDVKGSPQSKAKKTRKMLSELCVSGKSTELLSSEVEIVSRQASLAPDDNPGKEVNGNWDEEEMEVDIGSSPSFPISYAPSHRRGLPLNLLFFAFQPKDRHKMQGWNDDLFILPHLPESYMIMHRHCQEDSYDCSGGRPFIIVDSKDCVHVDGDSHLHPGWQVELSGNKIPLYTFGTVDKLLTSMLVSSHVLPKSQVKVTHTGSREDLRYQVTVRCSEPLTSYELTSGELDTRRTKEEIPPRPLPKSTSTVMLDWRVDRPLFALLSLILRENKTANISEVVGLSPADLDLITSTTPKALNVGEQQYKVFTEALTRESSSLRKFSQLLCILTDTDLDLDQSIKDRIVFVITSYMRYKQLSHYSTIEEHDTKAEIGRHKLSKFIEWARTTLGSWKLPCDMDQIVIEDSRKQIVFMSLSTSLLHVWKMVGRLLLLEDSDIDAIEVQCTSMEAVLPSEMPHKMLYSWSQRTENQSDVTYNHLYTVLQIISRCYAAGVVADAIFCLHNSLRDELMTSEVKLV